MEIQNQQCTLMASVHTGNIKKQKPHEMLVLSACMTTARDLCLPMQAVTDLVPCSAAASRETSLNALP